MGETYTVAMIPPDRIREVWGTAKRYLQKAIDCSQGRWTSDYVLASLVLGEQSLWMVTDSNNNFVGAVTSQIAHYPNKKMLAIHFLGGRDFGGWYDYLLDTMTRFAKDMNCDGIEALARQGFWKWFQQDGFVKDSAFYEKSI